MRRLILEALGILLLLASIVFFLFSVRFLGERDYIAAVLLIFVGFSLVRGGLELTKLSLLAGEQKT